MYQALYRKYRPRSFSDVAGQEHVTETLRRQIVTGRLSHAYLFVGTRGTGKTTCAKILARAVNCLAPVDGDPCNKCAACIGIENGSILDVLELDAASNRGIDDIRALREDAIYTPATVKKRVYILDEAHMLTSEASNAILKILEEPPEHLIFVLATTEPHKIKATILSRCQKFSFKRLSPSVIAARLHVIAENEGLTLTDDAAERLSSLADGSMRDAISLLDQCATGAIVDLQRVMDTIGLMGQQEQLRLIGAVGSRDTAAALNILQNLYDDGRDMAALLSETGTLIRDLLICKLSPDSPLLSGGFGRSALIGLSENFSPGRLFACSGVIRETMLGLARSGSAKLAVEMCLIRLCDERLSDNAPDLLARIERLEGNSGSRIKNSGSGTEPPSNIDAPPGGSEIAPPSSSDTAETVQDAGNTNIGHMPGSENLATVLQDAAPRAPEADSNSSLSTPHFPEQALRAPEPGDFWPAILELLKSDPPVYALLSDSSKIQAELQSNILIISAGDIFTVSSIESKMFLEPLKTAALKALGREVAIRVQTVSGNGEARSGDKLGSLRKFNNVKFE